LCKSDRKVKIFFLFKSFWGYFSNYYYWQPEKAIFPFPFHSHLPHFTFLYPHDYYIGEYASFSKNWLKAKAAYFLSPTAQEITKIVFILKISPVQ